MQDYSYGEYFLVFKAVLLLFILCFLQACQNKLKEEQTDFKANLQQAAVYNVQLGLGYLKQGARPRAKKKLLLALEQAPNSPDVNAAMAYYFEQTKELEQAKKYYALALSLSSNSGAQLNNYGAFLCRQGEYLKAESYFLKAVKDISYLHTSGAYENAGLCCLAIPDYLKAKRYFKAALNQDPSRRESLYELVKIERQLGEVPKALEQLKKYPDIVLNDNRLASLARNLAKKNGDIAYLHLLKNTQSKINTSGVNNEYSNEHG